MKSILANLPQIFADNHIDKYNLDESEGVEITTYSQLREIVAELSCLHPESVLFFRGQAEDFKRNITKQKNKKSTSCQVSTFFPSIYRGVQDGKMLEQRWKDLNSATQLLQDKLKRLPQAQKKEFNFLLNRKLVQWSVLQHYEVTPTPLLDVTQSLRVACSFAFLEKHSEWVYIYAFALPYPTGRLSRNSEHYITTIRLLSVIPSCVRRPHFQEGFLVGEDEIEPTNRVYDSFDFRRRLVGKFKIHKNQDFWSLNDGLVDRPLSEQELYPDGDNILCSISNEIKDILHNNVVPIKDISLESFLDIWNKIDLWLHAIHYEYAHGTRYNIATAQRLLNNYHLSKDLTRLRQLRNHLVHIGTSDINLKECFNLASNIYDLLKEQFGIDNLNSMVSIYKNRQTSSDIFKD